jgi:hypothetical protein
MARAGTSVTADAIRIEDEVWQEAFETRVPSPRRRRDSAETAKPPSSARLPAVDTLDDRVPPFMAPSFEAPSFEEPRYEEPPLEEASGQTPPLQAPPAPSDAALTAPPVPARRTIKIQGRGAERNLPWPGEGARRRPSRTLHERAALRPDRVAMWAVFLGLLLVFVAALSAHG